jgi:nitrite reductase/ring-hydroxylating ferredoxin subunit
MLFAELKNKEPVQADGDRLVAVRDLPPSGVVEVETSHHGTLAVGMADGKPFATANRCRHHLARLGRGQVRDGCVESPAHRVSYDVRTGKMKSGPIGMVFGAPPYSKSVQTFANVAWQIRVFAVELRGGEIWLKR